VSPRTRRQRPSLVSNMEVNMRSDSHGYTVSDGRHLAARPLVRSGFRV